MFFVFCFLFSVFWFCFCFCVFGCSRYKLFLMFLMFSMCWKCVDLDERLHMDKSPVVSVVMISLQAHLGEGVHGVVIDL